MEGGGLFVPRERGRERECASAREFHPLSRDLLVECGDLLMECRASST